MPLVTLEGEDAGLAAMLAGLVQGNLEADPGRARYLKGNRGVIGVVAADDSDQVEATLAFDGTALRARPGLDPDADVVVRASYEGILGLSQVPMRGLMPLAWRPEVREMVKSLATGKLKVSGLFGSPKLVLRLLALVSVDA
jgi:hypothetical protein